MRKYIYIALLQLCAIPITAQAPAWVSVVPASKQSIGINVGFPAGATYRFWAPTCTSFVPVTLTAAATVSDYDDGLQGRPVDPCPGTPKELDLLVSAPQTVFMNGVATTFSPPLPSVTVLAPNMIKVCDEGCTITAVSSKAAEFQFGTAQTWNQPFAIFSSATLPLVASDAGGVNPALNSASDPALGVVKEIDAQKLPVDSYTVTWSDGSGAHVTIVPPQQNPFTPSCTAIPNDYPIKVNAITGFTEVNFQIPAVPSSCALLPNMAALQGGDGAVLTGGQETTPVIAQRCTPDHLCSAPFLLCPCNTGLAVGPTAMFGGPVSSTDIGGSGQLFILRQIFPNTITFIPSGSSTETSTVISAS